MDFNFFRNNQQQNSNIFNQDTINQIQQIMQLIGNRNPKDVFYELCKIKGVNPDDILKQLR